MRAVAMTDFDTRPSLQDIPALSPGANEVLVRVRSSSVNPVDAGIAAGMLKGMFDYEFPVVLGRDYAGTIEAVGAEVEGLAVGDDVLGFLLHADPAIHTGAWAERIIVPAGGFIATKPEGVEFAHAGAAPLAATTAVAAVDALAVKGGDTVVIVGASGGVGSFTVQLVKRAGATVIAPGLAEDEDYLRSLGADHVVSRDDDLATAVHEIEPEGATVLIDTVSMSPEALEANAAALGEGGRVASPNGAAGEGADRHNVMASDAVTALATAAERLGTGDLTVPVQRTYSLEQAPGAIGALSSEHTQGKLAIEVG